MITIELPQGLHTNPSIQFRPASERNTPRGALMLEVFAILEQKLNPGKITAQEALETKKIADAEAEKLAEAAKLAEAKKLDESNKISEGGKEGLEPAKVAGDETGPVDETGHQDPAGAGDPSGSEGPATV